MGDKKNSETQRTKSLPMGESLIRIEQCRGLGAWARPQGSIPDQDGKEETESLGVGKN